jgi:type I restriction enzyme M protein
MRSDHESLVSLSELARMAGVSVATASNWRRHDDFPASNTVDGKEYFDLHRLVEWLARRRIAKSDLQPGEPAGTTYADRIKRDRRFKSPVEDGAKRRRLFSQA